MLPDIVGTAVTAALGVGVAATNYLISKYMLTRCPDKFVYSTVLRTIVLVLFLVITYFVGSMTPCSVTWLLVGAATGATLPTVFFTARLLKLNQAMSLERRSADITKENSKEKEE